MSTMSLTFTQTVRSTRPPHATIAALRESARSAGWAVPKDEGGQIELWSEGALTAARASITVKVKAVEDLGSTLVTLTGTAGRLQLLGMARLRKQVNALSEAARDPSSFPPARVARSPAQQLISVATILLVAAALAVALKVALPTKMDEKGRETVALPSVALGSEVAYRLELGLLVLYGGLIAMVPLYRGLGRGDLPIEISTQGARYEEVGATVTEVGDRLERLEARINQMAIDFSLPIAGRKERNASNEEASASPENG